MQSRDFCYWLQGYFEIQGIYTSSFGNDISFTQNQLKCITNHLNLVFKCEEFNSSKSYQFCLSVRVDLDLNVLGSRKLDFVKIRESLNNVFTHEIDNTFTGDKIELQQIHDGDKYDENKAVMRC